MNKMNPEIKEKWVTALRSGQYKQGRAVLHNVEVNSYCCLGVLCEIAVADGVVDKIDPPGDDYVARYGGSTSLLPNAVVEWSGISDERGRYTNELNRPSSLTSLNDSGISFADIAEVIERRF